MARQYGLICLAFGLFMMTADTCQAQLRFGHQAVQRPLRFLGHGNGPGYHHCNPGPDVSYYSPWTHKNSFLISQSPQYLSRYGHETQRSPMQLLYSSNSPYSYNSNPGGYPGNAMPLNADFVPSAPKPADTEDEEEDNREDSPATEDVDDRFDEEADKMDDLGGFDSLDEERGAEGTEADSDRGDGTTAADGASLLQPADIYLPASHPIRGIGK